MQKIKQNEKSNQIYEEIKSNSELWHLFTRKEEYNIIKLDKHNRFSYKISNYKEPLQPRVSEYLIKKGFNIEYPDDKKFAVVLTHDIDDVFLTLRHALRSFIPFPINKDFFGFKKLLITKIREKKSPYLNFSKIIDLEKKYNAKSSFYFLADENDIFGNKYLLENLQEEISYIIDEGCEIGLHTGYNAFDNLYDIKKQKNKIEQIIQKRIISVRNHLLRFKIPESWELLSDAGFEYDTSLGYYDMIGFRNGMCHPFQPFNLIKNKKIEISEIPVCVIDIALFSYMKINAIKSWEYIKNLIDTVERFGGVVTILWHNWTFSFPVSYAGLFGVEWTKLYEKILIYCTKKNSWITNGYEIYKHYKKQGFLKKN